MLSKMKDSDEVPDMCDKMVALVDEKLASVDIQTKTF